MGNTTPEPTYSHPSVEADIKRISEAFDSIQLGIGTLLADERYSKEHRDEKFNEAVTFYRNRIQKDFEDSTAHLEQIVADNEALANFESSVSDADAPKMLYTKDALLSRWQAMSYGDMIQQWETSLKQNDQMTARIYRDFSHSVLLSKIPASPNGFKASRDPAYIRLAEQTKTLLMTDEQRIAADKLAYAEKARIRLSMAHGRAKSDLDGASYDHEGNVKSGNSNRMMRSIRQSW